MSNVLTDEARYKAGKSQMGTFLSNQYLMWRRNRRGQAPEIFPEIFHKESLKVL